METRNEKPSDITKTGNKQPDGQNQLDPVPRTRFLERLLTSEPQPWYCVVFMLLLDRL